MKKCIVLFGSLILYVTLNFSIQSCTSDIKSKNSTESSNVSNAILADTRGGAGGEIIKVTNLNSKGEGSFRSALSQDDPRIIVFEVGGVIDLEKENITINKPYVTIAGQTAPSPGITLIRGGISIATHDVIVRHLKVRPGDAGESKKSGWEVDGIATSGAGGNTYNILIDHNSVTWATDENISASGPRLFGPDSTSRRVTISNNLIAEGLSNSTHSKGEHSKGTLIHDGCENIVIARNLYAHNVNRNPYYKTAATGITANNLIYNPGNIAIHSYWAENEWEGHPEPPLAKISVVGNVLMHGPDTQLDGRYGGAFISADHAELYLKDNQISEHESNTLMSSGPFNEVESPIVWDDGIELLTTDEVTEYVLSHAGARPADRDPIDKRIITSVINKEGKIIDSQEEVGGYPDPEPVYRELDIPDDNIQEWLDNMAKEVEG